MIIIKKFLKFIQNFKRNEKGEITLQVYAITLISLCIIMAFVAIVPVFVKYQNLVYITKKVVQDVEFSGEINSDTYELLNSLSTESNLHPTYKWEGDISTRNRVQLRNQFTLTLSDEVKIKIIEPSFTAPISITIPIHKKLTGKSQTYWKPGNE